jgi:hypothetical protein
MTVTVNAPTDACATSLAAAIPYAAQSLARNLQVLAAARVIAACRLRAAIRPIPENNTLRRLKMAAKILGSRVLGSKYLGPKYFW